MSERYEGEPDPTIILTFNEDEKFEMNPSNASLYTFLGRTVIGDVTIENEAVNHVFVNMAQENEEARGMYLFREFHPVFNMIAQHMVEHRYPMILNQRTIPACDMQAYVYQLDKAEAQFATEIPDCIPDDLK